MGCVRSLRPSRRERGTVLIEAALTIPLIIVLVFGVIEYGWLFAKNGELVNAARNGARVAVRADAISQDVTDAVDNLMTQAELDGSGYTLEILPNDVTSAEPGTSVTVRITVTYANIELTGFPLPLPETLAAEVTMAKEGS